MKKKVRKTNKIVICSETLEELNYNDVYIVNVVTSKVPYKTYVSKSWQDKHKSKRYKISK